MSSLSFHGIGVSGRTGGFSRIFSRMPLSRVLRVGHERTAKLAIDAATTLRALPASVPGTGPLADRLEVVGGKLKGLLDQQTQQIDVRRGPLKLAVEKAIFELREGLEQMDARLRAHFGPAFIESLYPELNKRGTAVADVGDEDDDEAAPPDGPEGEGAETIAARNAGRGRHCARAVMAVGAPAGARDPSVSSVQGGRDLRRAVGQG